MAATQARFIFGRGKRKAIGSIVVSAFVREGHMRNSNVTRYPTEEGSEISDHIINEPIVLNISGVIEASNAGDNIIAAFRQFNDLMDNKELVTVVTGLKVYDNYHITSLNIPRTSRNGASLSFEIQLTEVRTVRSQSVSIPITQLGGDTTTLEQSQPERDIGKATSGQTQITDESNFLAQVEADVDEIIGFLEID